MKIVVAGGSGWLGSALCRSLVDAQHDVVVLTRDGAARAAPGARSVSWDGRTIGAWAREIDGAGAVINLAGAPLAPRRWTARRKQLLRSSRLDSTRMLVTAMGQAAHRPATLINTSAVGYYGDRGDRELTEIDRPGRGFLADLVKDWEAAALPAAEGGIRVVLPRVGVVLGEGGGALPYLALPFRLFVGGHIGSGQQWVSWVSLEDVVGAYRFCLDHEFVTGPVNVTAPRPVSNRELSQAIGRVLSRPCWAPVPGWAMQIALGELASTLLAGQRVIPDGLIRHGYRFRQPELQPTLRHALT